MRIEEVARRGPKPSGSPDTEVFSKNFKREFLESQRCLLAEILYQEHMRIEEVAR